MAGWYKTREKMGGKKFPTGTTSFFGWSVSIDGDRVAVSEPPIGTAVDQNNLQGKIHMFTLDKQAISIITSYQAIPQSDVTFNYGKSISLCKDILAVGDIGVPVVGGFQTIRGKVYIYVYNKANSSWEPDTSASAIMTGLTTGDRYGFSVSISNNLLVVGVPRANPNTGPSVSATGAIAVYHYHNGEKKWNTVSNGQGLGSYHYSSGTTGILGENLGRSVSISGTYIAVGAPGRPFPATGSDPNSDFKDTHVYIFKYDFGTKKLTIFSKWPDPKEKVVTRRHLGESVSIYKDYVAVGAPDLSVILVGFTSRSTFYALSSRATNNQQINDYPILPYTDKTGDNTTALVVYANGSNFAYSTVSPDDSNQAAITFIHGSSSKGVTRQNVNIVENEQGSDSISSISISGNRCAVGIGGIGSPGGSPGAGGGGGVWLLNYSS